MQWGDGKFMSAHPCQMITLLVGLVSDEGARERLFRMMRGFVLLKQRHASRGPEGFF